MARYQFSSGGERPRKPVSQVVQREQQFNAQKIACYRNERPTQEISFSGRIGKKSDGKREKPMESCRYSQFKFNLKKLKTLL